jgi:hypothetical protein
MGTLFMMVILSPLVRSCFFGDNDENSSSCFLGQTFNKSAFCKYIFLYRPTKFISDLKIQKKNQKQIRRKTKAGAHKLHLLELF